MKIHVLDASTCATQRAQLADLLLDAVAHGGSLGFLAPLDAAAAHRYWQEVAAGVDAGACLLIAAAHEGTVIGTVQLDLCQRPNGRNRAEVRTMMVHSRARRRGIGSVLLRAVEAEARERGRGLLFLDTEAGSGAEQLVHGLGYTRLGELPDYACTPHGEWRPAAIYYKTLFTPERA